MYSCVATNPAGTAQRDINLDVYNTPAIVGGDSVDVHDINKGKPFTLECLVEGFPRPRIEVRLYYLQNECLPK